MSNGILRWNLGHCAECKIVVRFNFLTIDVRRSRSGEGVPVKFCAKTETPNTGQTESIYSKSEPFQAYGTVRKTSVHVQSVCFMPRAANLGMLVWVQGNQRLVLTKMFSKKAIQPSKRVCSFAQKLSIELKIFSFCQKESKK